jgi:Ras-related protein Rab-2A
MSYKYLFKIIIVGESGVGKSCLLLQFTDKRFNINHDITIGVEFGAKMVEIDEHDIKLQIWDTAGQESFRAITRSYYRNSAGAVLVYDISRRKTFKAIQKWLQEIRESSTDGNIMITLVGNKCDNERTREISYDEGKKLAESNNMGFFETSAKTGHNIKELFMNLTSVIYEKVNNGEIPVNANNGIKTGLLKKKKRRKVEGDNYSYRIIDDSMGNASCCYK